MAKANGADAQTPPRLRVSELGEFVRFESCERRFKLSYNKRAEARRLPFFERLFNPLDPILQQAGNEAEDAWQKQLRDDAFRELAPAETVGDEDGSVRPARTGWAEFADRAETLVVGECAYGREILVAGTIGAFALEGAVDFVLVDWVEGRPRLHLIEGKSSRKDRTYHRIQLVCYWLLLRQELEARPLVIAGESIDSDAVKLAVARIEEDTGRPQELLALEALGDVRREHDDIERLLAADGRLAAIVSTDVDLLAFQLSGKCDGCVFNVDCLTESGRQRRLELLGIEPSVVGALHEAGLADIDALAQLELDGDAARMLHRRPGFTESLARLRARARARRSTLPRGEEDPDYFQVRDIPGGGQSQLPEHVHDGEPLVRVYLAVDYDYTENRVGALSAHVTRSPRELHLTWRGKEGARKPDPAVYERHREAVRDATGKITGWDFGDPEPIGTAMSREVIKIMGAPWTGQPDVDTGAEKHLLQEFFSELVDAIEEVCGDAGEEARLHFYVWTRQEISRLVEACARADSRMLGHLRQLLGARESLEQLLFSSVGEEVDRRYGLGWTGRGLLVCCSLSWFGQRFHWTRKVARKVVELDRLFTQDLFDFKTTLGLSADGNWAKDLEKAELRHRFEVRARNFDSLPAPYWRAMWGTLPDAHELNSTQVKGALARYGAVDRRSVRAYLATRVQALRWIEERVAFKNAEITKDPIAIADLPRFDLGVGDIARASIDVLRLDGHVRATGWISEHLASARERVACGITLPLKDVRLNDDGTLSADINLEPYEADLETLMATWGEGEFVRLTVHSGAPDQGQSPRQLAKAAATGRLLAIDWDKGEVRIETIFGRETHYVFGSCSADWAADAMRYATLDESPSDFVAGKVEQRLLQSAERPAVRWLDPTSPDVPEAPAVDPDDLADACEAIESMQDSVGLSPDPCQVDAIIEGLQTTVHLLQGPPGTGKTATAALSVLARVLLRREVGDVILIGSNTHTAVNELLVRIADSRSQFSELAEKLGLEMPDVRLVRVEPNELGAPGADEVINSSGCIRLLNALTSTSVVVIGATTNGLLKLAKGIGLEDRYPITELVVDEASMVVFPHFLALATLLDEDGLILLAGDNRQLAPILAHDWEGEDRPPIEIYQPHISAYDAIARLADHAAVSTRSVRKDGLSKTFRLPPRVVELIARVYQQDGIVLTGVARGEELPPSFDGDPWEGLWTGNAGLFLVVHEERSSRKANPTEVAIIDHICAAEGICAASDCAVVTPHRAQRQMLSERLGERVDIVDTVERLQGGERSTVIVSGCASDPSAIASSAEFVLNLNRSNVAFSRVRDRLIVVCASTLLDHIPAEIEHYDSAMLWKSLRATCDELLATTTVDGHAVRIYGPSRKMARALTESALSSVA